MRPRLLIGSAVSGLAFVASYALQHLLTRRDADLAAAVLAEAHVPYTFRVGTALVHGVALGLALAFAARDPEAWVERLPAITLMVALPSAILVGMFP